LRSKNNAGAQRAQRLAEKKRTRTSNTEVTERRTQRPQGRAEKRKAEERSLDCGLQKAQTFARDDRS
jgi:hypothetical protein